MIIGHSGRRLAVEPRRPLDRGDLVESLVQSGGHLLVHAAGSSPATVIGR